MMKIQRLSYMLFMLLAGCQWASAQENVSSAVDTSNVRIVYVHDTVYMEHPKALKDSSVIIRTKSIGRFDRGISNYRFLKKGKWIGGVTFSVYNYETDNSRLLFSIIKDMDVNFRTLSVHPFVGYTYADNNVVGFKFGYSHNKADINNVSISADDIEVSLKNIHYSDDMFSFNAFHRSYVGLDAKGMFSLFNETTLGYNTGTSRFQHTKDGEPKYTDTSINQIKLGINPGIAVMIMPNVGAEVSFGVAGFTYNWERQTKSTGEIGKRHNSGANFKINLLNINIGITICI